VERSGSTLVVTDNVAVAVLPARSTAVTWIVWLPAARTSASTVKSALSGQLTAAVHQF
jgi:hypothetical protein